MTRTGKLILCGLCSNISGIWLKSFINIKTISYQQSYSHSFFLLRVWNKVLLHKQSFLWDLIQTIKRFAYCSWRSLGGGHCKFSAARPYKCYKVSPACGIHLRPHHYFSLNSSLIKWILHSSHVVRHLWIRKQGKVYSLMDYSMSSHPGTLKV